MSSKKAFIFDTNFILQNKDLSDVVKRLGNGFVVYAAQLSIEERLSQEYIELQKKYERLDAITIEFNGISKIEVVETFEQRYRKRHEHMQKGYDDLFKDKIVPFSKDAQTFEVVWDRIHKKLPPFRAIPGSGDKGFKDALLWITILWYFKTSGEHEVVFLTDDKGFLDHTAILEKEFNDFTGKKIEIKSNQYYESLTENLKEVAGTILHEGAQDDLDNSKGTNETRSPLTKKELVEIREKIKNAIGSICRTVNYDGYDHYEAKNFILREKVDEFQARDFLAGLREAVDDHLLHDELDATVIFSNIKHIENGQPISIESIEFTIEVFNDVQSKIPQYLGPFFRVVADILNKNYEETEHSSRNPFEDIEDDGDLPF
jgi:hypothetical protein